MSQRIHRQSVRVASASKPAPAASRESAASDKSAAPPTLPMVVKRAKLGWPVREDLIKQCKQIALDEGKKNYETLEDLLLEALEQRCQRATVDK